MRCHSKALFAVAVLFAFLSFASIASAAPKGVIGTFGESGTEGGKFGSPAGVAVNQSTGDVYVTDAPNQRIEQFDADGAFIRAWGKDVVADGGPGDVPTPPILTNEQQSVGIHGPFDVGCFCFAPVTGGTFTLSFDGETSGPIPYDATAAQVQSALEALGNVDTVTVTGGPGPSTEWTVEFTGALAGTDVAEMTADGSGLEPSGSEGSVSTTQNGSTNPTGPTEICTDASTCREGKTGNGEGEFSFGSDPQLAIDQSDGSLYVTDTQNHRIQKFSSTGVFQDEFGTNGSGQGEFSSPRGVAVDPASGDVYVADTDNNRVQRFESDGTFVDEFGSAGSGDGEFFSPTRVAADSTGRLYVLDSGNSRVQRFDDTGTFEQVFAPGSFNSPSELAIDPSTDDVLIAGSNADSSITGILEFDPSGALVDIHAANAGLTPGGLAARSSSARIYVSDPPNTRVAILAPVTPPTVTIEPVTAISADGATFNATINPEGPPDASYRFEYSENGTSWIPLPATEVPLGQGTADIAVSQSVSGLDPNTEYKVRLFAKKDFNAASVTSPEVTFTTSAVLPIVQPLDAGVVSATSAWLGANVDPRKAPTTFYVQYTSEDDPTFANATSVPASQDASAGSGKGFVLATRLVKGLQPSTTYLFRVVATNAGGTTTGESRSFTTLADLPRVKGLPDGRVWEKVSPAYKAGSHISSKNSSVNTGPTNLKSQAASDGNAVTFASEGKFGGDGGPAFSQYMAKRGESGWVTEGINPRLKPSGDFRNWDFYYWYTPDLSHGVVKTNSALNPDDPEKLGDYTLYLRDNETKTYSLIPDSGAPMMEFRGASEDASKIFFASFDVPNTNSRYLFQRTANGDVEPVGILPNGTEVQANIGNGLIPYFSPGFNPVSTDGSKVFFTAEDGPEGSSGAWDAPLYRRESGTTTTLVSASERFGDDPEAPRKGHFLGASKDGSVAFFSSNRQLTDESNLGEGCGLPLMGIKSCLHLYRWDASAPEGDRLTDLTIADPQGVNVPGMTAMSDDGSSAYFVAAGDLTASGKRDPRLYLWREGEGIRLVAEASDPGLWALDIPQSTFFRRARVTPDGRYLAFESKAQLTGYDTDETNQVYLYDSLAEKLSCVSCSTISTRSKAESWLLSSSGQNEANGQTNARLPVNLSPDGRRLVFDSADALVPEDTNGAVDVYEWTDGRLHLLSSGTSATPSRFLDASADLDDVFFTTEQKLVNSDIDSLRDLYDARVGGVPEPDVTPPCVADECQGTPTPPPSFQTPSSANFKGAGDPSAANPRCAKGKVRRKGRCVRRKARKANKQAQRAKGNGRAGR